MKRTTSTGAVLALTTVGVVLTAGAAAADTPTPGPAGQAWTVTDVRPDSPDTTLAPSAAPAAAGSAAAWSTTVPTPAPVGDRVGEQAGERRMRRAPVHLPRRRQVARTGHRLATGCRSVRGGVWIVRPGDTLWRISICTHRDLVDLVQVNDLPFGGRLIFPGDRITVRPPVQ